MTQLLLDMPAEHTTTVHAVLPDFSTACGFASEDWPAGDGLTFGANWSGVTCPWCHSLGRAWFSHAAKSMQARQS